MDSFIRHVSQGIYYNGQLIYPSAKGGMLICIDADTGKITLAKEIVHIKENESDVPFSYSGAIYIGDDKFLLFPKKGNEFIIYNALKQDWEAKVYDFLEDNKEIEVCYWNYKLYKNQLFLFPLCTNHILQIDLETLCAKKHENIIREIDLFVKKDVPIYFCAMAQYNENTVILAGWESNYILKVDLYTMDYQILALKNETDEAGFQDIEVCGDYFYTVNHKYHVFKYKKDTCQLVKRITLLEECGLVKKLHCGICFIPAFEEPYMVDFFDGSGTKSIPYPAQYRFFPPKEPEYCNYYVIENKENYYIMRGYGNTVMIIEKDTGDIRYIPLIYDEGTIKYMYENKGICIEGKGDSSGLALSVNHFIEYVSSR